MELRRVLLRIQFSMLRTSKTETANVSVTSPVLIICQKNKLSVEINLVDNKDIFLLFSFRHFHFDDLSVILSYCKLLTKTRLLNSLFN